MHPAFREAMLRHDRRELEARVARASAWDAHRAVEAPPAEPVVLRLSGVRDDDALERLAQLEGRPAPAGRHVVAEIEGTVVAALPLGPGPLLADPFRPTAHLVRLLERRARQLAHGRLRPRPWAVRRAGRHAAGENARTTGNPTPPEAQAV
jgi:hypothetical protein